MFNPFRRPASSARATVAAGEDEIRPCSLCLACVAACPTGALRYHDRKWSLDLSLCTFCQRCTSVCPNGLIGGGAVAGI